MKDAAVYEDNIPRLGDKIFLVHRYVKGAFQNADNLIFHMPMVRHDVAGMRTVYMIKFKGKIESSSLFIFTVIVILHKKQPPKLDKMTE